MLLFDSNYNLSGTTKINFNKELIETYYYSSRTNKFNSNEYQIKSNLVALAQTSFENINPKKIENKIIDEFEKLKSIDELILQQYKENKKINTDKIIEELKDKLPITYIRRRVKANVEYLQNEKRINQGTLNYFMKKTFDPNSLNAKREKDLQTLIDESKEWLSKEYEQEYLFKHDPKGIKIGIKPDEKIEDNFAILNFKKNQITFKPRFVMSFFHKFILEEFAKQYEFKLNKENRK